MAFYLDSVALSGIWNTYSRRPPTHCSEKSRQACQNFVLPDEIGSFEAKRAGASRQEVACQLWKNIKIHKSIFLKLEKCGLECP